MPALEYALSRGGTRTSELKLIIFSTTSVEHGLSMGYRVLQCAASNSRTQAQYYRIRNHGTGLYKAG